MKERSGTVEIEIEGEDERRYTATVDYHFYREKYGEDADGNRGEWREYRDVDVVSCCDEQGNAVDITFDEDKIIEAVEDALER